MNKQVEQEAQRIIEEAKEYKGLITVLAYHKEHLSLEDIQNSDSLLYFEGIS